MNALDSLRESLRQRFVQREAWPPLASPLPAVLACLEQQTLRRATGSLPPGVTTALYKLRLGSDAPSFGEALALCGNLHRTSGWEQQRPIDDARIVGLLLTQVARLHDRPLPFARAYRALLRSHLSLGHADLDASRQGVRLVAEFLQRHADRIAATPKAGRWTVLLARHRELLAARPPAIAVRKALGRRLALAPDGWLDLNEEN